MSAGGPIAPPPVRAAEAIWHEAECGGYAADLALWEELAARVDGPVLDLGCGTGRVALRLARHGHRVTGLDAAPSLLTGMSGRAAGLPLEAVVGDARDFELDETFGLVLAPMQLAQLFADGRERARCLRRVAAHLAPGGLAAFAIVESMPSPDGASPPLPDTREIDGWVYSSLPIEATEGREGIRVRRLRQTVAPDGELSEEVDEVLLRSLDAATLEREAAGAGLQPAGRRRIEATAEHVGSTVVLLEKGS